MEMMGLVETKVWNDLRALAKRYSNTRLEKGTIGNNIVSSEQMELIR